MADIFTLFGRIAINADEAARQIDDVSGQAGHLKKRFESVGNSAMQLGRKIKNALVAAGVTKAVSSLVKASVSGYAEYEQLVGGVETLFGAGGKSLEEYAKDTGKTVDQVSDKYNQLMNAQGTVFKNAQNAYQTAGVSANQYMDMATGFAASLISGLKGDTEKAAQLTDMAILDMSDNANKMGTDLTSIQNAYQGFAKQNYTMLDNLKLGYGGTQSEMKRLLRDAQKLSGQKYNIKNLSDIIEAIHVIQEEMDITGTTEKEAAETISGSINSTKAAWENLVMGLADGDADIESLFNKMIGSAKNVVKNIAKVVPNLLKNMGTLLKSAGKTLVKGWEQYVYPWIQDKFKVAFGIDLPDWETVKTTVTDKLEEIKAAAMEKLSSLKGFLGKLGLTNDLQTALENVKSFASDLGTVLLSIGQWATGDGAKVVETVGGAFLTFTALRHPLLLVAAAILLIATNWEKVKETVGSAFDSTASWLAENLGGPAEKFRENVIQPIAEGWNDTVKPAIKNAAIAVGDFLGIDLIERWNTITDALSSAWESVKNAIASAAEALSNFFGTSGTPPQYVIDHPDLYPAYHGGSSNDGAPKQEASGLRRVPYDGYKARLHENEAVLTASQAAVWRGERMPSLAGIGAVTMPVQTEQPVNLTINISGNTNSPYEVAQAVRNAVDDWRWRG